MRGQTAKRGAIVNAYEQSVLKEWMVAATAPQPFTVTLTRRLTGKARAVMNLAEHVAPVRGSALADRLRDTVRDMIVRTLEQAATARQYAKVEQTIRTLGGAATSASEIRLLPLEVKDETARLMARGQTVAVSIEGATAGFVTSLFEVIPGLQAWVIPTILADLYATLSLMAQNAVQIGYSYGYSLQNSEDLPHILVAMAPCEEDAQIVEAKVAAHLAMRSAGSVLARTAGEHLSLRLAAGASPAVAQLLDVLAARLALAFAEKEVAVLVPFLGAVVQGSVNAAFAKASYHGAKRYFQKLHMIDRYGDDYVLQQSRRMEDGHRRQPTINPDSAAG